MSRATNLRLLLTAVAAAAATSVSAQGLAQLPGAGAQQPAASGTAARTTAAPAATAARAQGAAQQAQPAVEEELKPRNPLEAISRLNAEIATLKAQLQATDLKAQIKKKEEELNPPPKVEKKEEAAKVSAKKEEPKLNLPPLPNLNALLPPGAPSAPVGGATSQAGGGGQQQAAARPATRMDPQLLAIEGIGDNLRAELMTDWGGWAEVVVGDKYYDYKVEDIKGTSVVLSRGQTRVQLAMTNSRVNRLQSQTMMSRNMPSSGSGGVPVPADGGPVGGPIGGPMGGPMRGPMGMSMPSVNTTGMPANPVGPVMVPDGMPLAGGVRAPADLGVNGVKAGPPAKPPF